MGNYDWNKNGKIDSFDRYMDYQASHSMGSNSNNSNYQHNSSYQGNGVTNIDEEKMRKIRKLVQKQQPQEEQQPPYLAISIISILVGVLFAFFMLMANK